MVATEPGTDTDSNAVASPDVTPMRAPGLLVPALALLAAFALCYGRVLADLVVQWTTNQEYNHGFLIPVLSLYFLSLRKDELRRVALVPRWAGGVALLGAGLLALVAGRAASIAVLEQLSLLPALAGLVLLVGGRACLRLAWFPIAYLVFMIPFWDLVTDAIYPVLQRWSAAEAVLLLGLVGVPVYQDGLLLHLPNVDVEVAKACSGTHFLVSIIAIGIPLGYLYLRGWVRRVVLVVFAIGVALLGNGVRVALIAGLFNAGVMSVKEGVVHALQAVLVSWIGFAALFAGTWLMSRGKGGRVAAAAAAPATPATGTLAPAPAAEQTVPPVRRRGPVAAATAVAVGLLLGTALVGALPRHAVPPRRDLASFPDHLGDWTGQAEPPLHAAWRSLGPDHELSRLYRGPSGAAVHLYVAYFASQEPGRKIVNDETSRLHESARPLVVRLAGGGSLAVERASESIEGRRLVTLFWYDVNGRTLTSRYAAKAFGVADAILRQRTNGAVVIVSGAGKAESLEAAEAETALFAGALYPLLRDYLP